MDRFDGKLAVVTGAGSGMGRELARQLVAQGCNVALCDINGETLSETVALAHATNPAGVRISAFVADTSDRDAMRAFAAHVGEDHATDHIDLLFNNAGVGGGESFVMSDEREWERTFDVCWQSVYGTTRVFLPLLMASPASVLVNISSVHGFIPTNGRGYPVTAYASAKYAVKGFTESLITDLEAYAPNVKAVVVMPGHIATSIAVNTSRFHDREPLRLNAEQVAGYRARMAAQGADVNAMSDDDIRTLLHRQVARFESDARLSAAGAATAILHGVRAGKWRILVGDDARLIDRVVRRVPNLAFSLDAPKVRWYIRARFGPMLVRLRLQSKVRGAWRQRQAAPVALAGKG